MFEISPDLKQKTPCLIVSSGWSNPIDNFFNISTEIPYIIMFANVFRNERIKSYNKIKLAKNIIFVVTDGRTSCGPA